MDHLIPAQGGRSRSYMQRINHIWSERERRKEVQELYDRLRLLLPLQSHSWKMDRCEVIAEAMALIQSLQRQIQELALRKSVLEDRRRCKSRNLMIASSSLPAMDRGGGPVGLHICESDVFLSMSCSMRQGLVLSVLWILRQHQLLVQDATISIDRGELSAPGPGSKNRPAMASLCIRSKALDIRHLARESLELSLYALIAG
ncbi:transcription factor bHLH36-like [Selaginella moellendorffii]|uniref:transcription factor bHLH36-like n=1 Tax=Selaginella moellendorffii TaxID=88036 RepID=UPI000D1D03C3|nr:transcription factor bHLH36-like [Selaginella moellendorffii]|eukprot:XP_024533491.1 transcription factor bHLH36-like [Selaginella moellendorffii]